MAHLWVKTDGDQWAFLPLDESVYSLSAFPPATVRDLWSDRGLSSGVVLLRNGDLEPAVWVVLAHVGSQVSINGSPLSTGVSVVADRDEIRVPGINDLFFSTEKLAMVEEFPQTELVLFCPRCKQEINQGTAAVRCPGCGVWHHQSEELNCWTYSQICALCPQATDLNAGFQWVPEDF